MKNRPMKFWSAIFGEIEIGQVYTYIKGLVKCLGYKHVTYDPVFDMAEIGDAVDVHWIDRVGNHKSISFVRTA